MDHPEYRPAWQKARPLDFNLVLEGGGFRGQFTSGVLDLLMDEGILPTTVIGVSAGALTGANFAAGMRGRTNYLNTNYCDYWRYFSMKALFLKGNVFDVNFTFGKMLYETDPYDFDSLAASPIRLITVASDLETGDADYFELRDLKTEMDYLRASASMPVVSRVVHVGGKKLLDGGIADSVPIEYSKKLGAKKHIVVLTQDATYVKGPNKSMALPRLLYRKYPKFIEAMEKRHIGYNRLYAQLVDMHNSGEIFLLRPQRPVTISTMESDKRKMYALYLSGYEEAKRNFSALKAYLS
jgi:predicted patatin/cPLA2 family phospholipase